MFEARKRIFYRTGARFPRGVDRDKGAATAKVCRTARPRDLPDLLRFMLATGVRVGEAVAVHWDDVDLVQGVVVVDHTVIRAKGVGLVRKSTKTEARDQRLALPAWCVDLLRARRVRRPRDVILFPSSPGGPKVSYGGPPVNLKKGRNRLHFDLTPSVDGAQ